MIRTSFRFDSLTDFMNMGGHGAYVWSAYAVSIVILAWLCAAPVRRRRKLVGKRARQQRDGDGL